jgi:hypothetical protein
MAVWALSGAGAAATGTEGRGPAGGIPPFGIGDWAISDDVVLDGALVLLDGNLTVLSGGSLTLRNTTLQMQCAFEDEHELRVKKGGAIRVLDCSTVAAFDTLRHAGFWVEDGATAVLANSTFIAAGVSERAWWPPYIPPDPADLMTSVGGVVIMTPDADINNCTFSESPIALSFFHTNGTIRDCLFTRDYFGALSHTSNTTYLRCTFTRNQRGHLGGGTMGAAAWSFRSNTLVEDCIFTENNVGVCPDTTNCTIRDCSFYNNTGQGGVFMSGFMGYEVSGKSSTTIENCSFVGNWYGIANEPSQGTQNLSLRNCEFRDNSKLGIWWDNRRPGIKEETQWEVAPNARWLVDGPCELENDTFDFNGSVTVANGGSLRMDRATFIVDSDRPFENNIEIGDGGSLSAANGTELRSFNASAPYSLVCRPGSAIELDGAAVRDCGWEGNGPERSGPCIECSGAVLRNCTVDHCERALVLVNASGATVEGSSLEARGMAVSMDNSTAGVFNSTFSVSGGRNVTLGGGSRLLCVNSTLDTRNLRFLDQDSLADIGWHLGVRVLWSDGRPVEGASVVIRDSRGNETANLTAGPGGRLEGIVVREATLRASGNTTSTPHVVRCGQKGVVNETRLTMDRSLSLVSVLQDVSPPVVTLLSPSPEARLSTASVAVVGTVEDDVAIGRVSLTVDGSRRHTIYEFALEERTRLDWNLMLELREGAHSLELEAEDTSGNFARASIYFTIDFTRPNVLITSPADGLLTGSPELSVRGVMEPGTDVFVNGVLARTAGGTFDAEVRLIEGDNLVSAVATDLAGNSNTSSISVRLDTIPPALDVAFHPIGPFVNDAQLTVSGTMESGASVTVNGRWVVLPGLAQNFSTLFFLAPGNNTIRVEAADAAGNINSVERRFVLDTVPPSFSVLYPPDGLLTNAPSLEILMLAEAGTEFTAGNVTRSVPGPAGRMVNFSVVVQLAEGPNGLLLSCRDAAGNVFSLTRLVTMDTTPPALALDAPSDGARTQKESVYVVGRTEPDAAVTVNGERLDVGAGGSFSGELRLGAGRNRIVVRATDALGNARELTLNVTRQPAGGETPVAGNPGPDWPFWGFLAVAAVCASGEGWWLWRRQSVHARHLAPGTRHPDTGGDKGAV